MPGSNKCGGGIRLHRDRAAVYRCVQAVFGISAGTLCQHNGKIGTPDSQHSHSRSQAKGRFVTLGDEATERA